MTLSLTYAELQQDLALKTRRGINALLTGVVLWTTFAVLGATIDHPMRLAVFVAFGAGALFPLSLGVAAAMKIDAFAKGNPLGTLAGLLGAVQVLYIPAVIGIIFLIPEHMPWMLAVLVGAHFLPYAWLYRSVAYVVASVGLAVSAGAIAWLLPEQAKVLAPAAVAVILAVSALLAFLEDKRLRQQVAAA